MKKRKRITLLSHAVIVLALSLITFFILDIYNPMMGFLSSRYSRVVFCLFCALGLALAVVDVVLCRKADRQALSRAARQARAAEKRPETVAQPDPEE